MGFWALAIAWWNAALLPSRPPEKGSDAEDEDAAVHRLLLDAAPTPLLAIDRDTAHVLNRVARTIFASDDRILPVPAALLDPSAPTLRHEGRLWRIDRVEASSGVTVAALIDVEREELAAEARASADLIEVLGHELLNGLSPIVSLAESAQTAAAKEPMDAALLAEILGPLARRRHSVLDQGAQIGGLQHDHVASARNLQQVLDQTQHGFAALAHRIDLAMALRVQAGRARQQVGIAGDTRQGGAHLMAHQPQELLRRRVRRRRLLGLLGRPASRHRRLHDRRR